MNIIQVICLLIILLAGCKEEKHTDVHYNTSDSVPLLTQSTSETVVSGQKTIKIKSRLRGGETMFHGVIMADESRNNKVAARVGGRIEKLHTKFNYQTIRKGSPVFEIYSPELNTAVEEHLLLYKINMNDSIVNKSYRKLRLLGLTEKQIKNIEKNGNGSENYVFYSPYEGYLIPEDIELKQTNGPVKSNTGMNEMSKTEPIQEIFTPTLIKEGAYINKGQTLFTINDLKQVWGMITINSTYKVNKGDRVLLHFDSDTLTQVIQFVEPFYQTGQQFSRARINLQNDGTYKLYDLFRAELKVAATTTIYVPTNSILDLGNRKVVWVKSGSTGKNNLFKACTVTTGNTLNGQVEILSGLKEGDEIAEVAGFFIDSESLMHK